MVPVLRLVGVWLLVLRLGVVVGQSQEAPATQCLMQPLPAAERAARAAAVVEAEVLDAQGEWDQAHQRIYTRHRLHIYKVLKGGPVTALTILTEGGQVGLDRQTHSNTLQLTPGQQGVFFLTAAQFAGMPALLTPYGSAQGFVQYELPAATAAEPFQRYPRIDESFYQQLVPGLLPTHVREVSPNDQLQQAQRVDSRRRPQAVHITQLFPLTITAGTGAILTLEGTGFGSSRGSGYVAFPNADNGGATLVRPQDSDYVTWTDTRIEVKVPTYSTTGNVAGSGSVTVVTSTADSEASQATLKVVYAVSTVQASGSPEIVRPNHKNQNGRGGYSFRPTPEFLNVAGAAAAFQRALTSWRCQTGVNWNLGAARAATVLADDNENGLGFDTQVPLPARVLGRTTSYYQGCRQADGRIVFAVKEIDMVFDDAEAWQFGPEPPAARQYDFESVVVHELGHAQQLSHLILPGAVMHYAVAARQQSRELNLASEVAGGRFVLTTRSFRALGCGPAPMLPAPVQQFEARRATPAQVSLTWTTADECFVQEYVVESSQDTSQWTVVGKVPAGNTAYSLTDNQATASLSYYRLGVVRPSGEVDYTAPRLITDGQLQANQPQLFPNPVARGGQLLLQLLAEGEDALVLRCYDATGRLLNRQELFVQAGLNRRPLALPAGLKAGWYVLRWSDQQGHQGQLPFIVY